MGKTSAEEAVVLDLVTEDEKVCVTLTGVAETGPRPSLGLFFLPG